MLFPDSPGLLLLGPTALEPCPVAAWETEEEAVEGLPLVGRPAVEEWAAEMLGLSLAIWLELKLSATPMRAEMGEGWLCKRGGPSCAAGTPERGSIPG